MVNRGVRRRGNVSFCKKEREFLAVREQRGRKRKSEREREREEKKERETERGEDTKKEREKEKLFEILSPGETFVGKSYVEDNF